MADREVKGQGSWLWRFSNWGSSATVRLTMGYQPRDRGGL
jgi:hypothetical protein